MRVPAGSVLPLGWLALHWHAIHPAILVKQAADYIALVVVTAFTLLLGIISVEVDACLEDKIDVDRELRVNGLANVAAGLAGGMAGTLSLSRTLFNYQNGARSRLSGAIVAAGCLLMLALGTGVLSYIPVLILGGILLRLGVDPLDEWLLKGWRKMSRSDYAQVVVILFAIVLWGLVAGVILGVIVACVTFAVNTGRTSLVKQQLDRT